MMNAWKCVIGARQPWHPPGSGNQSIPVMLIVHIKTDVIPQSNDYHKHGSRTHDCRIVYLVYLDVSCVNLATRISSALQYVHKVLFSTAIANMPLMKRQHVPHPELSEHSHDVGPAVLGERSRDDLQCRGSGLERPLLYAFHFLRNPPNR